MKTKKGGVLIAMAVVLLFSAVLFTTCQEPIILQYTGDKGIISLNIGSDFGRTVFPTGTFAVYEVTFTPDPSQSPPNDTAVLEEREFTSLTGTSTAPIELIPGWYTLEVKAFRGPGKTNLAAEGEIDTPFQITRGNNPARTVNLVGFVDGDEEGFLVWNFTFPDVPDTVTIEVLEMDETLVEDFNPTAAGNITNSITPFALDSGYYIVRVTMDKAGFRSIILDEVVHIYDFLTSTYTRTFPAMINNEGQIQVSIVFNPDSNEIEIDGPATFVFDIEEDAGEAITLRIEIDPTPFDGGSIVWKSDNGVAFAIGVSGDEGEVFTLAFDTTPYASLKEVGSHTITVIAITDNDVPFSASYTFTVVDTSSP